MNAAAHGQVEEDLDEDYGDDGLEVDSDSDGSSDNVGDVSVEINVESLIEQIERESRLGRCETPARKRLEELMEARRSALETADFDDYDF